MVFLRKKRVMRKARGGSENQVFIETVRGADIYWVCGVVWGLWFLAHFTLLVLAVLSCAQVLSLISYSK